MDGEWRFPGNEKFFQEGYGKQAKVGHSWQRLPMTFLQNVFFTLLKIRSKEMKGSAFERGDLDASLEKRMKSFGDVFVVFWSCEVK